MDDRLGVLWLGARPVIGTVVGVGIFGLPFVFSKAGFLIGTLELLIVAGLSLVTFYVYSDLLSFNRGRVPFVATMGNHLGPIGRLMAAVSFLGSLWGAMLAYVLVGGEFLENIFKPIIGGEVARYQMVFWIVASACMVGGPLFVRRLQSYLVPLFFVFIVALSLVAIPHLHFDYLAKFDTTVVFLPFGTLIFAFSGLAAISESRDALGRNVHKIKPALLLGVSLISVLYLLFCFAVVGLTGPFTSMQAVEGLRLVSPWLSIFVSLLGLSTLFTAYISVGNAIMNSLMYDFRGRFLPSWLLTVILPITIFSFGILDFIDVIGATGGLLGGLAGLILMVAYEKARLSAPLPKRTLHIPQSLIALSFILFAAMILMAVWQLM